MPFVFDVRPRSLACCLAMFVLVAPACGGGRGEPPAGTSIVYTKTFGANSNRNLDLLFVIDDSSSSRLAQDNLIRNFSTLITTLQGPTGQMPDIHIGVISSDMGAGDGSIAGCDATRGKNGIFQYTPRGTCTSSGLQAGATFISDVAGVRNYTGTIADVFRCIAPLGEVGCGFEQPFAAVLRALGADGALAPVENQMFLRPDASLAVVFLSHRDDCSASPGLPLFDTGSNATLASQLGPPIRFRCNEFGHLCQDASGQFAHPMRLAPSNDVAATVPYTVCTSNDREGYLLAAVDTANRIKALKADPRQVVVASIQGPMTPYVVSWRAPVTADTSCGAASCPWPRISLSCMASDGSFGEPGLRTAELVAEFGAQGLVLPICADSFAPSLQRIGELTRTLWSPPCIEHEVRRDPERLQPECKVSVQMVQNGTVTGNAIPSCADTGNAAPCWTLTRGSQCPGSEVSVTADPTAPWPDNATLTVSCALCDPGVPDPVHGCP